MSYNKCCVLSCTSKRKNVSLYKFPKNEKLLELWLKNINCESLKSMSVEGLFKRFVCIKHFEKRFVISNPNRKRSRLRICAYPTLFTESEITHGIPQISCTIGTNIFLDIA